MPLATIDQVESIIKELKNLHNFTDEEIFDFMVKTGEIPGKDWSKEVVMPCEYYQTLMRLLVKYVK